MSAQPNDSAACRLRRMREDDLDAVMDIEERAYPYPWTRGIFADCLQAGYACLVCEERGWPIGYGVMAVGAGEAHVMNVCVSPEHQREGIGRRILAALLELARDRGARVALLEVRPSNTPAVALYRRLGFVEIGRRKGYYPDRDKREDALVLSLRLDA